MIRAVERMDKEILLVVFARGTLLLCQAKVMFLNCIPGITIMWNYWNLLDLGLVFDAVWMMRIVLPTRVRFSLLFSVLVYE